MTGNYIITNGELYHYGVKGMKWGHRRALKREEKLQRRAAKFQSKTERKYRSAGIAAGEAEYYRKKGDEAAREYDTNAKTFEKAATTYERSGQAFKAIAARKIAEAYRQKAKSARANFDEQAKEYTERSEYLTQKANKFAAKKNVDLGKSKVDSILKESKSTGMERARKYEEQMDWQREVRDRLNE